MKDVPHQRVRRTMPTLTKGRLFSMPASQTNQICTEVFSLSQKGTSLTTATAVTHLKPCYGNPRCCLKGGVNAKLFVRRAKSPPTHRRKQANEQGRQKAIQKSL